MKNTARKGFTLLEMIIAVGVLVVIFMAFGPYIVSMSKSMLGHRMTLKVERNLKTVETNLRVEAENPLLFDQMTWASRNETAGVSDNIRIESSILAFDPLSRLKTVVLTAQWQEGANLKLKTSRFTIGQFRSHRQGARIYVRVEKDDGGTYPPLPNVLVTAPGQSAATVSCTTDGNGECQLIDVAINGLGVPVTANGSAIRHYNAVPSPVTWTQNQTSPPTAVDAIVDMRPTPFRLRPPRKAIGYVYNAYYSEVDVSSPAAGVKVFVYPTQLDVPYTPSDSELVATTDVDGKFSFDTPGLIPGKYKFYVIGSNQYAAVAYIEGSTITLHGGNVSGWGPDVIKRTFGDHYSLGTSPDPVTIDASLTPYDFGNKWTVLRGSLSGVMRGVGVSGVGAGDLTTSGFGTANNMTFRFERQPTIGMATPDPVKFIFMGMSTAWVRFWSSLVNYSVQTANTNGSGQYSIPTFLPIIVSGPAVLSIYPDIRQNFNLALATTPNETNDPYIPAIVIGDLAMNDLKRRMVMRIRYWNAYLGQYEWSTLQAPYPDIISYDPLPGGTTVYARTAAHAPNTQDWNVLHKSALGTANITLEDDPSGPYSGPSGNISISPGVVLSAGGGKWVIDGQYKQSASGSGPHTFTDMLVPNATAYTQFRFWAETGTGNINKAFNGYVECYTKTYESGKLIYKKLDDTDVTFSQLNLNFYHWNGSSFVNETTFFESPAIPNIASPARFTTGLKSVPTMLGYGGVAARKILPNEEFNLTIKVKSDGSTYDPYFIKPVDPSGNWVPNLYSWSVGFPFAVDSFSVYRGTLTMVRVGQTGLIGGKVLDAATGTPIIGAQVTFYRDPDSVMTDWATGRFIDNPSYSGSYPRLQQPTRVDACTTLGVGACAGMGYQYVWNGEQFPLKMGMNYTITVKKDDYPSYSQVSVATEAAHGDGLIKHFYMVPTPPSKIGGL